MQERSKDGDADGVSEIWGSGHRKRVVTLHSRTLCKLPGMPGQPCLIMGDRLCAGVGLCWPGKGKSCGLEGGEGMGL
eukprot:scaffold128900_cov13-Tisochrysis_lutea.AAC.1